MKTILIASTLLFVSVSSFATDISCVVLNHKPVPNPPTYMISSFSINNLESDYYSEDENAKLLESDLPDQNAMDRFSEIDGQMSTSFSNECDNGYSVGFPLVDFKALLAGQQR